MANQKPDPDTYPCLPAPPPPSSVGAPRILRNHGFFVNSRVIDIFTY